MAFKLGEDMTLNPPEERRFFILVGEASGDRHGAALMRAMIAQDPASRFAGIGGSQMRSVGMDCLYQAEELALVGFTEVIRQLPFLWRAMGRTVDHIIRWRPERVILIDYPGFNLRLARLAHRAGFSVTYYIAPQLWAWREERIATIRRYVDQLLVIFPFELGWYEERGVRAQYVGHPILEEPEPDISREDYLSGLGLDPRQPVLTLFPGSRRHELDRHLQLFRDTAQILRRELPNLQVVLGLARGIPVESIPSDLRQGVTVTTHRPRLALRYADAAIIASGTSTLEAAVWGVPMAVVYRMSPFSWWLSRRLVKLPHVGMVNILAGKEVAPEFLQNRAQPGPLAQAVLVYFQDEGLRAGALRSLSQVRRSLLAPAGQGNPASETGGAAGREPGASQLAAQAILGRT